MRTTGPPELPERTLSEPRLLPRTGAAWASREKSRDHQREHGRGECDADPEPPRHIAQLWVGAFGGDFAGFERHSADWAGAWSITHDLRVHRAGIFGALGWCGNGHGFERHAALRTASPVPFASPPDALDRCIPLASRFSLLSATALYRAWPAHTSLARRGTLRRKPRLQK